MFGYVTRDVISLFKLVVNVCYHVRMEASPTAGTADDASQFTLSSNLSLFWMLTLSKAVSLLYKQVSVWLRWALVRRDSALVLQRLRWRANRLWSCQEVRHHHQTNWTKTDKTMLLSPQGFKKLHTFLENQQWTIFKAPKGKRVLVNIVRVQGRCVEGCWEDGVEFKMTRDPRTVGYRLLVHMYCVRSVVTLWSLQILLPDKVPAENPLQDKRCAVHSDFTKCRHHTHIWVHLW